MSANDPFNDEMKMGTPSLCLSTLEWKAMSVLNRSLFIHSCTLQTLVEPLSCASLNPYCVPVSGLSHREGRRPSEETWPPPTIQKQEHFVC